MYEDDRIYNANSIKKENMTVTRVKYEPKVEDSQYSSLRFRRKARKALRRG